MTKDPLALYKLIILYMLDCVDFPLTKAQVGDFVLDREYMNFMTLSEVIGELIDSKDVSAQSYRNRTHLKLTKSGSETIGYFKNEINPGIREEIEKYFKDNSMKLRNEVSVLSECYLATSGEWEAHLLAKDRDINLVDITLSVPSEETAQEICENWSSRNQEIYQFLVKNLF